ncbi:hypothetical protein C9374_001399 [Naegleria lovaniensis]|uniref:Uncharacterized protein n=1 Tax=Naegleria lovaniensis TaxID=51637 RepID=A0AA88KLE7_NAELO|nr:uncharacterized protein C9374_001399 [Naegleria lovaniensis]KAG2387805.1 hypothetical protein C9374_001399 [Naegleria lovaniensis]
MRQIKIRLDLFCDVVLVLLIISELVILLNEEVDAKTFGMNNNNHTELIFEFNNTLPSSSVVPFLFNITKEKENDNLKIFGGCGSFPCNFMIIKGQDYLEFLKNPSLGLLRKNAARLGLLNTTNVDDTLLFVGDVGLYAFIVVNSNGNDTWLSVRADFKYSYGRHVVLFLRQYWYIVLITGLVIVVIGLVVAFVANKAKGREMLNGMTSYSKKNSQQKRALLTEEDALSESFIEMATMDSIITHETNPSSLALDSTGDKKHSL